MWICCSRTNPVDRPGIFHYRELGSFGSGTGCKVLEILYLEIVCASRKLQLDHTSSGASGIISHGYQVVHVQRTESNVTHPRPFGPIFSTG